MKTNALLALVALTASATTTLAQAPGKPEDNGLTPTTETLFVNLPPDDPNNGSTESVGVGIASNGNVLVGWEDDAPEEDLTYNGGVWTLYSPTGTPLIPKADVASVSGEKVNYRYRAFFRPDGSAVGGHTAWGPKIKANPYGSGIGMGAIGYGLGTEIPAWLPYQNTEAGDSAGDWPVVQLLNDAGEPIRILSGVTAAFAETPGGIRIGDWEYLSNGNVVIVGENRQIDDLVNVFGGDAPAEHLVYRVLDASGNEVKGVSLLSETLTKANAWHGAATVRNGWAMRFDSDGRAIVRLFFNDGSPASGNLDLATVAGAEVMNNGGRGDAVGFHGNGRDAYAAVAFGNVDGALQVWVTVLNANGTLRWAKNVSEDMTLTKVGRADVAIDEVGRVVVVYDDSTTTGTPLTLGRLFDAKGEPIGGTFYVSEKEAPELNPLTSQRARVAFRNRRVAVAWESRNGGVEPTVVALRVFEAPPTGGPNDPLEITSIQDNGTTLTLTWTGGTGTVQIRPSLSTGDWVGIGTGNGTASIDKFGDIGFIRISR